MKLTCDSCKKHISIPDEKIPKGKAFSISCPECKNKITVPVSSQHSVENAVQGEGKQEETHQLEEIDTDALPSFDLGAFDFQEEGKKNALICDPEKELFAKEVTTLGYSCHFASSHEDAMNKIRFTVFDMIIINESFAGASLESNPLLQYLQPLQMSERRKMFVVLVGEKVRTLDNMAAYVHSVNLVMNKNDLKQAGAIMKRGLDENEKFFRVIRQTIKDVKGREE